MLNNLNFKYFSPDALNARIKDGDNITFSIFHMNIHSLNKNSDELCQFLSTINHSFDILVLSEIWLYNITMFRILIPGYTFYYDLPVESYVGGIGIYPPETPHPFEAKLVFNAARFQYILYQVGPDVNYIRPLCTTFTTQKLKNKTNKSL